MSTLRRYRILISGWYGFGNLGDEAILKSISREIEEQISGVDLRVLSFDPAFTEKYHGIKAAPQLPSGVKQFISYFFSGKLFKTLNAFVSTDIVLIGGGGFLSDWQPEAPWKWLRQALLARMLRKKIIIYGIGAGPFTRTTGKWITKTILNNFVNAITVRDRQSAEWLKDVGVKEGLITITADPALNYPVISKAKDRDYSVPKKIGISVAPIFHLNRFWPGKKYKYERYRNALTDIVKGLIREGFEPIFIPMHEHSDVAFAEDILLNMTEKIEIKKLPAEIDRAVAMLGDVDILISMRHHSAILGVLQGIPVAAIIYSSKVAEFVDFVGLRKFAEEVGDGSNWQESDINSERMLANIKNIAKNYANIKKELSKNVSALKKMEKGNLKVLRQVIGYKP